MKVLDWLNGTVSEAILQNDQIIVENSADVVNIQKHKYPSKKIRPVDENLTLNLLFFAFNFRKSHSDACGVCLEINLS